MSGYLKSYVAAAMEKDPAATSKIMVLFTYPGVKALMWHRPANWCYRHKMKFLARVISQHVRFWTGIEIHPGATIGKGVFIDHGAGVVIGETAEVGNNVTLYQGVTLGGTGKDVGKRHPTIGNGVMIGAGAKVLGPFKVGDNSNIAAGAVVLDEIPENCTAVGVPARIVKQYGKRVDKLDHIHIPDPVSQELCKMSVKIDKLQKELEEERKKHNEDI